MTELERLPNIGPTLALALRRAGIDDADALRAVGAEEAWRRVHPRFDCLHSLTALAGAVAGVPKRELDAATRAHLLEVWRADAARA